ncbi:hypothetical protein HWC66_gp73 [Gordonia phage Chikenjars]|uniref:Uncharacterized protein n=1 Tax=Gordonia phage Chikenjars TaxID=2601686 RepID=A0A5J6D9Z5_9CAUD|nr:hypothetical protein HWC66_gp73 [Gordonia phage Chikenjars]QEQ94376.1 hypothetical protein SEA_CHIKENJARS_73 [Gordonia phage Chikenjars]
MKPIKWVRDPLVMMILAATTILLFTVFVIVDDARTGSRLTEECRSIGGQTWDRGEHCVIGKVTVIVKEESIFKDRE